MLIVLSYSDQILVTIVKALLIMNIMFFHNNYSYQSAPVYPI